MKTILIIIMAVFFHSTAVAQETDPVDGKKAFEQLFAKVDTNNSGQLCVLTKNDNSPFLIEIDGKNAELPLKDHTYCVSESIKLISKDAWYFLIHHIKGNDWEIEQRVLNKEQTKMIFRKAQFTVVKGEIKHLKR